jgi:hypothetical protein
MALCYQVSSIITVHCKCSTGIESCRTLAKKRGIIMYDYTKLSEKELIILATYILQHDYPQTDMFDEMCSDLAPLKIRKLKGTIGCLTGHFYNDYFLSSPYWKIITQHYCRQGICPICGKMKNLILYSPTYNHLGINHLHPEDNLLACGVCHKSMSQFMYDHRFWKSLSPEDNQEVSEFLSLLLKFQ